MVSPTETTPAASAHVFETPFADLTLRAVADGSTARVHRGIVAFHSRVFSNALTTPDSPPDELPLPGKDASDLRMLVAYMYPRRSRTETFTAKGAQPRCLALCASASSAASGTCPSCSLPLASGWTRMLSSSCFRRLRLLGPTSKRRRHVF